MILIAGDTYCHSQGIRSVLYAPVNMKRVKVSCLLIVNGDRHLVSELGYRVVPCYGE